MTAANHNIFYISVDEGHSKSVTLAKHGSESMGLHYVVRGSENLRKGLVGNSCNYFYLQP